MIENETHNFIFLSVFIPIFIGTFIILIVTLAPINTNKNDWKDLTKKYIYRSSNDTLTTNTQYIGKFITSFFDKTQNDMLAISSYIEMSQKNTLNVINPYKTYFSVPSVDINIPQRDVGVYFFDGSVFIKGINNQAQLSTINQYIYNQSSIYDIVLRAIYKSSNIYDGLYFGFEENGFYRYYPYVSFQEYPTFSYRCASNNLPVIGYDPRCRIWYVIAKNNTNIMYTSPCVDALTGNILITSSKRIMNGTNLLGVIGIDFSMNKIDNIIEYKLTKIF